MSGQEHTFEPIVANESEKLILDKIKEALDVEYCEKYVPQLVSSSGEVIKLPKSVLIALRQIVYQMLHDRVVGIVAVNRSLTTQEAADILNVSRPYLVKLLEEGQIPFTKIGAHRRIEFDDLMDYKKRRDAERSQQLTKLTQMSQELGLYD